MKEVFLKSEANYLSKTDSNDFVRRRNVKEGIFVRRVTATNPSKEAETAVNETLNNDKEVEMSNCFPAPNVKGKCIDGAITVNKRNMIFNDEDGHIRKDLFEIDEANENVYLCCANVDVSKIEESSVSLSKNCESKDVKVHSNPKRGKARKSIFSETKGNVSKPSHVISNCGQQQIHENHRLKDSIERPTFIETDSNVNHAFWLELFENLNLRDKLKGKVCSIEFRDDKFTIKEFQEGEQTIVAKSDDTECVNESRILKDKNKFANFKKSFNTLQEGKSKFEGRTFLKNPNSSQGVDKDEMWKRDESRDTHESEMSNKIHFEREDPEISIPPTIDKYFTCK